MQKREKRGVTLVELLIVMALVGMLALFSAQIGSSFQLIKKEILDEQTILIKSNLATATTFERVLRAGLASGAPFNITDSNTAVNYTRQSQEARVPERIAFNSGNHTLEYYVAGNLTKVLLENVAEVSFTTAGNARTRLIVNLELTDGEVLHTAVTPRNQFTPQSIVN